MITLFTTFRSFNDPIYAKIQSHAVSSWLESRSVITEFLVFGDDPGVSELCEKENFTFIPEIQKDERNTPFLNEMLQIAEQRAKNDIILLVSGDIIISPERLEKCVQVIKSQFKEYCICSSKAHIPTDQNIDFNQDWEQHLTSKELDYHAGDFFLFNKGFFGQIPNFLVGRCRADRWLFKYAISKEVLIDATYAIKLYHHKHHYNWDYNVEDNSYKYNAKLYDENEINIVGVEKYVSILDANYTIDASLSLNKSLNSSKLLI